MPSPRLPRAPPLPCLPVAAATTGPSPVSPPLTAGQATAPSTASPPPGVTPPPLPPRHRSEHHAFPAPATSSAPTLPPRRCYDDQPLPCLAAACGMPTDPRLGASGGVYLVSTSCVRVGGVYSAGLLLPDSAGQVTPARTPRYGGLALSRASPSGPITACFGDARVYLARDWQFYFPFVSILLDSLRTGNPRRQGTACMIRFSVQVS